MGFYQFVRKLGHIGVGVQDLAVVGPLVPDMSLFGPNYPVQRSFRSQQIPMVVNAQQLVPLPYLGTTGSAFAGQLVLNPLASVKSGNDHG